MIEIECPFCEESLAMEPAAFQAPAASVTCHACSVVVELDSPQIPAMALAA